MPPLIMGRDTPLYACLEKHRRSTRTATRWPASCATCTRPTPTRKEVIDVAKGLEGLRRQDGIHAAAVVITKDPLTEYLPIQRKPESGQAPEDAPVVTQYEMHGVEELGLLKMDFLGLRNLDVITDTRRADRAYATAIERRHRQRRRSTTPQTLRAAAPGRLHRRVPAGGRRRCARSCARWRRPSSRTSPRSSPCTGRGRWRPTCTTTTPTGRTAASRSSTSTPTPRRSWATPTALMIYQESVMRVAQKFAGYSLAEADNLRKACGKKIRELIAKERDEVRRRLRGDRVRRRPRHEWFDIIEPFADYAFNKTHATATGSSPTRPPTSRRTTRSSTSPPCSRASSRPREGGGLPRRVPHHGHRGARARRQPVGERLHAGLDAEDGASQILFGLSAVRNVGEGLVEHIVSEREENGPYADFYDFCERVDTEVLNKRTIESLIKAGGVRLARPPPPGPARGVRADRRPDRRPAARSTTWASCRCSATLEDGRRRSTSRIRIPDLEFEKKQRLAFEKEMLGLYVSRPSADRGRGRAAAQDRLHASPSWRTPTTAPMRTIGGVVTGLQRKWTKKGDLMAVFQLEDLQGTDRGDGLPEDDGGGRPQARRRRRGHRVGPGRQARGHPEVHPTRGRAVRADGRLDAAAAAQPARTGRLSDEMVQQLKELFLDFPGDSEVHILLGERQVLRLPDQFLVSTQSGLVGELRALLGADAVVS